MRVQRRSRSALRIGSGLIALGGGGGVHGHRTALRSVTARGDVGSLTHGGAVTLLHCPWPCGRLLCMMWVVGGRQIFKLTGELEKWNFNLVSLPNYAPPELPVWSAAEPLFLLFRRSNRELYNYRVWGVMPHRIFFRPKSEYLVEMFLFHKTELNSEIS